MRLLQAKPISRPCLSTTSVALLTTLFVLFADNRLFWRSLADRIGLHSLDHWSLFCTLGLAIFLLFNALLSLLAFRPVCKPFLITILMTAAAVSYFADTFGVVVDKSMIRNILETDLHEASELLSWPLIRHLLLFGVVPSLLVALTRVRRHSGWREAAIRCGVIGGSLVLVAGLALTSYKEIVLFGRANRDVQVFLNPVYPIYSLQKVLSKKYFAHAREPLRQVAADAVRTPSGPKSVVVLVLGETARAQEFAFNGYQRDTNPQLALRRVLNFPEVQACGTSTAESLPCIFSALENDNYQRDRAGQQENLLDILQRTGVQVLWRDNDGGSKGVANRVDYEDLSRTADAQLCDSGNCYDEILLRDLDQRLAATGGDMLIVLHMKGSHGPSYYKRTPPAFKIFTPECSLDNIQDCPQETIVNAYDNTILYTDRVLAELVDLLQAQPFATAMLYVSDHGESLGENGLYLHGLPLAMAPEEQTRVPMIFWASDAFLQQKSLDLTALEARRQEPYTHDFIFHSMLGLFGIETQAYRPELDLFAASRQAPNRPDRNTASRLAEQLQPTVRPTASASRPLSSSSLVW